MTAKQTPAPMSASLMKPSVPSALFLYKTPPPANVLGELGIAPRAVLSPIKQTNPIMYTALLYCIYFAVVHYLESPQLWIDLMGDEPDKISKLTSAKSTKIAWDFYNILIDVLKLQKIALPEQKEAAFSTTVKDIASKFPECRFAIPKSMNANMHATIYFACKTLAEQMHTIGKTDASLAAETIKNNKQEYYKILNTLNNSGNNWYSPIHSPKHAIIHDSAVFLATIATILPYVDCDMPEVDTTKGETEAQMKEREDIKASICKKVRTVILTIQSVGMAMEYFFPPRYVRNVRQLAFMEPVKQGGALSKWIYLAARYRTSITDKSRLAKTVGAVIYEASVHTKQGLMYYMELVDKVAQYYRNNYITAPDPSYKDIRDKFLASHPPSSSVSTKGYTNAVNCC